jgi:L-rhamnose-H+ transport protein
VESLTAQLWRRRLPHFLSNFRDESSVDDRVKANNMMPNPLLGVLFHWLGGLASASFYVPYKRVQRWSWEIFWIVGGVFSWIIAPWVFALLRTEHLLQVLESAPHSTLLWCWFWGAMWGFGGLTFGLTMRYLGMSLGMATVLGLTMVIGTLAPPIFHGTISALAASRGGGLTFIGIAVALIGVVVVGKAGRIKERELTAEQARAGIAEFNFKRGLLVAIFSGVMSSCFAFGLDSAGPIRTLTLAAGTSPLSQGLPVLCVVLAGGFTTNLIWCMYLIIKNKTARELVGAPGPAPDADGARPPLVRNYLFSALGGAGGTSSSFSTRWARAKWVDSRSRAGPFIWPASSSLQPYGDSCCASGEGRAEVPSELCGCA